MPPLRLGLVPVLLLLAGPVLRGAEASDAERKQAAGLVKELGSDDFAARESAEKALRGLGGACLPWLKEALKGEQDPEVKARLQRVVRGLVLECATDPDELAKYGREEALAKRYETAEPFYAKAAEAYRKRAGQTPDEAAKKEALAKAEQAAQRQQRAKVRAGGGASNDGNVIIQNGGGQVVIQLQGGLVVQGGAVVLSDAQDDGKEDW